MEIAKQLIEADWDYSAWATTTLLEACAALAPEERSRDLGASHASILRTLDHVFVSERFWVDCLVRNEIPAFDLSEPEARPAEPAFEELRAMWPAVWDSARSWLGNLPEDRLAETLRCRFVADRILDLARWQIVRHCVNHATLHRGQIVGMLRTLGQRPPNVDMTSYYHFRAFGVLP